MKFWLKNHLGKYKEITESTYNEIFKIDSSIVMVSIFCHEVEE